MNRSGRLPAILAAAALLVSLVLEALHVRAYLAPAAASFCAVGARFDCDAVALSRTSIFLGVPLALWGVVGFSTMLYAALRRPALLLPLAAVAAVGSLALLVVEIAIVHSVCFVCEAVHVFALLLFWVAWKRRDVSATRALLADPKTLASDLALPAVAIVFAAFFLPPYWTLVSWKDGPRLPHGVDADGRPWIGAEHPKVVVHEYVDYGCPHCAIATSRMRIAVATRASTLRIVRHHQPRMQCLPAHEGSRRCEYARIAICAGERGKFWEMDDWLFAHAVGHADVDLAQAARDVGLDRARLRRCVDDPATFERAQRDVDDARRMKIRATPGYVVDGRRLGPAEVMDEIDRRL